MNISTAYKAGDEVFRRDLLKVVYGKPDSIGYPSTVDKWRRQLTICRYLEETEVQEGTVELVNTFQTGLRLLGWKI